MAKVDPPCPPLADEAYVWNGLTWELELDDAAARVDAREVRHEKSSMNDFLLCTSSRKFESSLIKAGYLRPESGFWTSSMVMTLSCHGHFESSSLRLYCA